MEELKKTLIILAGLLTLVLPCTFAKCDCDVIVVRGDNLVDYAVASAYAFNARIPILFLQPDTEKNVIKMLLVYKELGFTKVLIIGGNNAIPEKFEKRLAYLGFEVRRIWDWDRYGTAARVAMELWRNAEECVLTLGEKQSSLLLAQKIAIEKGIPILFVKPSEIPQQTREALLMLGVKKAYLLENVSEICKELEKMSIACEILEKKSTKNLLVHKNESIFSSLILLITVLLVLFAFIFVILKTRKREYTLITPDEEKIIELLKLHGSVTQKRLVALSGFSKPKVSRILKSLEEKGIITRKKHGKTLKIVLKQR